MSRSTPSWVCCQLGAREHYAVPRALQLSGVLGEFITDLWIRPGTLMHSWRKSLNGRFHPALADAQVKAPNVAALTFELKASATGADGWRLISRRNDWFQGQAVAQLAQSYKESPNGSHTVFAYSYAAERIFKFARERGWRTVLGQIDPGPAEERIVAGLHEESSPPQNSWERAPSQYWERWRTECALADEIIVNSLWSKKALFAEGVTQEKIRIVPVAYEAAPESVSFQRRYPETFTSERPLRVLFLGQINLRKGVGHLFEAIKLLTGESIEFWFVGPKQVSIPPELKKHPQVKWFGVVSRLEVSNFYKQADLFILPTLSDGFGLTQLEAQSWKLPVVASLYCGEVVQDGLNGLILEEVSGRAIADVLLRFLRSPEMLITMSANSGVSDRFSLKTLASSLTGL
jgi:glycosyltransferase involved in cell wall biosynthesis